MLPRSKPGQSAKDTKAVLKKFEVLTPPDRRDDKVKVLFVRGYYLNSMGKKSQNDRGIYDDACFIVDGSNVTSWNANSDSSRYRRGIANLDDPQAIRYRPGLHGYRRKGGPYPAFRQDANATVMRDGRGPDYGMHYTNLHRGGWSTTSSLGCLTIPPQQWSAFYKTLKGALDKARQKTFYCTLVEYQGGRPPVGDEPIWENARLEKGSVGALVALMLNNLTELGYYDGVQDAVFGSGTEKAINAFQDDQGLVVDGIVGPNTFRKIDDELKELYKD